MAFVFAALAHAGITRKTMVKIHKSSYISIPREICGEIRISVSVYEVILEDFMNRKMLEQKTNNMTVLRSFIY